MMAPAAPQRRRDERGAVAVLTAILAITLFIMAAFVIDLGQGRDLRRQSQNAADASALAGANALFPTGSCSSGAAKPCTADAVTAVKSYASNNFGVSSSAWAGCTTSATNPTPAGYTTAASGTPCIAFDSATMPSKVWVSLPVRTAQTAFGGFTGQPTTSVRSLAEASIAQGASCVLCIVGNVSTNNSDFTVETASIAVSGDVSTGPQSVWTASSISIAGSVSGSGQYNPAYNPISSFTDPFASVSLPLPTTSYINTVKSNPCTNGPGVYGNVALPNSRCTLQPGIYVITGSWGGKNKTLLAGTGVTLYLKSTGSLDLKNGDVSLTAPAAGPTAGFVLLADRDATNAITLQGNGGNGGNGMSGKVYALSAPLQFNGNSNFQFTGGQVVIGGVTSVGNKSGVSVTNATDLQIAPGAINLDK